MLSFQVDFRCNTSFLEHDTDTDTPGDFFFFFAGKIILVLDIYSWTFVATAFGVFHLEYYHMEEGMCDNLDLLDLSVMCDVALDLDLDIFLVALVCLDISLGE